MRVRYPPVQTDPVCDITEQRLSGEQVKLVMTKWTPVLLKGGSVTFGGVPT